MDARVRGECARLKAEVGRLVRSASAAQGEERRNFRRQVCKCRRRIVRSNAEGNSISSGRRSPEPNRVRWPPDHRHPIEDSKRMLAAFAGRRRPGLHLAGGHGYRRGSQARGTVGPGD